MNLVKISSALLMAAFGSVMTNANAGVQFSLDFQSHTYSLLDTSMNWTDSEAEAVSLGGHLVTINDALENQFVLTFFANALPGNGRVWLGLSDAVSEGSFFWANGEPVTYTNWDFNEPNNAGNEDYVAMYSGNGFWVDVQDLANPGIGDVFGVVEVAPVPVPAAIWLLASGMIGLFGISRRNSRA
jgi:hypothetical protein